MPSPATFLAWAESLATMSYYAVLRVPENASPSQIKTAFHELALRCHPDRYVEDAPEVGLAAASVFKRGVEAYNILSKPQLRAKYSQFVAAGKLRMEPNEVLPAAPRKIARTLEMIARGDRAKVFARKADLLLSIGKLEDARLQLVSAVQHDPSNEALAERLNILYEALALEPL